MFLKYKKFTLRRNRSLPDCTIGKFSSHTIIKMCASVYITYLLLLSATLWIQFYCCLPVESNFGSHSSWPSNNDENSIYLPQHFILQFAKHFQLIIYKRLLRTRRGCHCYFCFKNVERDQQKTGKF